MAERWSVQEEPKRSLRVLPALAVAAFTGLGIWAVLDLPAIYPGLDREAYAALPRSGVDNPVAAVLLNYRAWDTLLEVGVLLLAMLGAFALKPTRWRVHGTIAPHRESAVLLAFTRLLIPTMLLVAIYLLYAGTKSAGGAFQGAAVLAAGGVLLMLGGIARAEDLNRPLTLVLALSGFVLFLAVGLLVMPFTGALLAYPDGFVYPSILAVETALTISIGVILALLYAGAAQAPPGFRTDDEG